MLSRVKCWARSLSGRLLLVYMAIWLLVVVLFAFIGNWMLRVDGRQVEHGLTRSLAAMTVHLQFDAEGKPHLDALPAQLKWLFISAPLDAGYRIFDVNGNTLLWSSQATRSIWERAHMLSAPHPAHAVHNVDKVYIHSITDVVYTPDGRQLWIQLALSERLAALRHDEQGDTFQWTVMIAAVLSVILLSLVLWRQVRHVMAPIERVSKEARRIEPRGPWQRLSTQGLPSEISPLVSSFNQALDRLEQGFERQQRFLADAAHELKTPLALIRAHIELGTNDRAILLQDIDHMSRQIQQLLLLAEVSEPHSYQLQSIVPADVVQDVITFLAPLATRHGVLLEAQSQGTGQLSISADRSALFVLLKNLMENAIYVAPGGSTVQLMLTDEDITIRDHGPGIEKCHLPHLFERFWRVPGSREGGAGLGLAICREVAAAHGWQLSLHNCTPGVEFRLVFAPYVMV